MTHRVNGTKQGLSSGMTVLAAVAAVAALGGLWSSTSFAQARPAIVKNVDEPGRTPWETRSHVLPNAGGCFREIDCYNYSDGAVSAIWDLRAVPAGKRWVVQSATGLLVGGQGRTNYIELGSPRGGVVFDGTKWGFGGPFQPGASVEGSVVFNAPVFAVFGPGEVPFVRVVGRPSLAGYTVIVFSGYLIDAT